VNIGVRDVKNVVNVNPLHTGHTILHVYDINEVTGPGRYRDRLYVHTKSYVLPDFIELTLYVA